MTTECVKCNGRYVIINCLLNSKEVSVQRALGLTIWKVYYYTAENAAFGKFGEWRSIKIDAPSALAAIQKVEENNDWHSVYQVNEEII